MRERPILFSGPMVKAILEGRKTMTRRVIKPQSNVSDYRPIGVSEVGVKKACPYGEPGDRLRVNETWATEKGYDKTSPSKLPKVNRPRIHYLADGPKPSWAGRTRSPRFMVKWASRITLEITGVRVERAQDITEADARAEGFKDVFDGKTFFPVGHFFKTTWDSLNAKRGYGWDANPWVWVIEFKRVEGAGA